MKKKGNGIGNGKHGRLVFWVYYFFVVVFYLVPLFVVAVVNTPPH